jgi:hypothetical protein
MPGSDDRTPADAERPPASRVGDELQQRVDAGAGDPEQAEEEALDAAREKGWDKEATHQA